MSLRLLVSLWAAVSSGALAQTAVLSIGSGSASVKGTVTLNIQLAATTDVAAVEWSLSYSADIVGLSVVPGGAALDAQKSVVCAAATCLAFGPNDTPLANGTLAVVTFQLAASVSGPNIPVQLVGVSAASPTAVSIPASGNAGLITVLPRNPAVERGRASAAPSTSDSTTSVAERRPVPGPVVLGLPVGGNAMLFSRVDGALAAPPQVSRLCHCSTRAVRPGEEVVLYVTGLGSAELSSIPEVLIGGVRAEVTFAGPASGYPPGDPRVDQINLAVPLNAPAGDRIGVRVQAAGGSSLDPVTIAIAGGR